MAVLVLDDRLLDLVDPDVPVEKISTGHRFTEGPVWHARNRVLTFSDVFGHKMHQWDAANGSRLFRDPSGEANGNTYDNEGLLVTCEHENRRVSRTLPDGTVETLVDNYQGKKLNSPNDVIRAPNGDLLFTDPTFGLRRADGSQLEQEYPHAGVFRYSAATGELSLLADDFVAPNGIVLTDDGATLYVDDSRERTVRAFDVAPDGSLRNSRVFCRVEYQDEHTLPDGMKLDSLGNLYVAPNSRLGIWVYAPDGTLLGMIGVGEELALRGNGPGGPANLAWGDDDWQTMFVTAVSSVYRLRMKVPGQPVTLPA